MMKNEKGLNVNTFFKGEVIFYMTAIYGYTAFDSDDNSNMEYHSNIRVLEQKAGLNDNNKMTYNYVVLKTADEGKTEVFESYTKLNNKEEVIKFIKDDIKDPFERLRYTTTQIDRDNLKALIKE